MPAQHGLVGLCETRAAPSVVRNQTNIALLAEEFWASASPRCSRNRQAQQAVQADKPVVRCRALNV